MIEPQKRKSAKTGFFRLLILLMMFVLVVNSIAQETFVELEKVIDDFEQGLPISVDEFENNIGYVPWGDTFENVRLGTTQLLAYSNLALPIAEDENNTVLTITYDIGTYGGFTHVLTDGENWIAADWTAYNAFSFWLYGANSGGQIQVEIFDNRTSNGDNAERWFYRVDDDFSEWRQITIPFEQFQRRSDWQPDGAPNDGLGLDAVSGYAMGFPVGAGIVHIDNVGLTTIDDTAAVIISSESEDEGTMVDNSITWDSRNWNLIWSDEFDGEAGTPVDDTKWTHEIGGSGWGNNERQYYTNSIDNSALDGNGNLAINVLVDESRGRACHYGLCEYTSARLITENKFEFTYGRVEARIKIPYGQGIWPAFWMLGEDIRTRGWPRSGEIDIMENIGKEPRITHGTIHGPGYSGADGIGTAYRNYTADVADDFHIYAVDWDENAIRWYVDGNLFQTLTPDDLRGNDWVYDHDFFILLNVAVGGYWPGYPDETTEFPQQMLVDYVRVYQLADE